VRKRRDGNATPNEADSVPYRESIAALDRQYAESGDLEDLRAGLRLTRTALKGAPKVSPERAWYLFMLGSWLLPLSLQTGDKGALAEGVKSLKASVAQTPGSHPERGLRLSVLAQGLHVMFAQTSKPGLLRDAVAAGRAAVAASSGDDPYRSRCLSSLGLCLCTLSKQSGDPAMLREAASVSRAAVDAAPHGDPLRNESLLALAGCLRTLFDQTADADDLAEAIAVLREGMADAPPLAVLSYQLGLGSSLAARYELDGDLDSLAESIACDRAALAAMTGSHAFYASVRSRMVGNLGALSARSGRPDVLAELVAACREDVAAAPGDPERLNYLGIALSDQFERTGDPDALAEALTVGRAAVAATSPGDPDRPNYLATFAAIALDFFNQTSDPEVLAEGVSAARAAVAASSPQDPGRASHLTNLAGALQIAFEQTGDLETLTEAVGASRAAAAAMPEGYQDRGRVMSVLGAVLLTLYGGTGNPDVLAEAQAAHRAALAAAGDSDPDTPRHLANLGTGLLARYSRTGEPALLAEAVRYRKAAVESAARRHSDQSRHLCDLGAVLLTQYFSTGDPDMLNQAVDASRAAVAAAPDGSPERARYLSNLGITLQVSYIATEEMATLTAAVEASQAGAATPGHLYGLRLNNLANARVLLYRRTGDPDTLAAAEKAGRAAVGAMGENQPDYAMSLASLSAILYERFQLSGSADALTEAVALARAAVASAPQNDPSRNGYLSNLCIALRESFEQSKDPSLLDEAVAAGQATVDGDLEGQAEYGRYATNFGAVLDTLYRVTRRPEALSQARDLLAKAARSPATPVTRRILAGLEQARAETTAGDDLAALAAVEGAMSLLPRAAAPELRWTDREYRLGEVTGIGESVAAAALSAGRPVRAVQLMEQARGQLLAEAMDTRISLNQVREHAPDLADEFQRLRARLSLAAVAPPALIGADAGQRPAGDAGREPLPRAARQLRQDTADDTLLARIRARDGLEDFLAAPSAGQLRQYASGGPVVMVTAAWNRSDALIVTDDPACPVLPVPLPGLTKEMAEYQVGRLQAACDSLGGDPPSATSGERDLHEILAWLWDAVASPVLAALGHTATPGDGQAWPRLWWCPVGTLALLPLHAAGHHRDAGAAPRTVMDRVVSSYTATLRALAYSRQGSPPAGGTAGPSLVVAMGDTPGADSLPGVEEEVAQLARLLPNARVLKGADATHASVTAALPEHRVAHFACHAITDLGNPAASRLLLHDHGERPLTYSDILRLPLRGADLAYLSACATSGTSPRLADEAVHMTSAFQMAGYRHVIGTLWPVNDLAAVRIATDVYAHLAGDHPSGLDTDAAAVALHRATRSLRTDYLELPSQWAPYMHTGA
jgi:CHAT domain